MPAPIAASAATAQRGAVPETTWGDDVHRLSPPHNPIPEAKLCRSVR